MRAGAATIAPMTADRKPSPAIVSQEAAHPLPGWALLALGATYVAAGFVGREPWKGADITAFAAMLGLLDAHGWRQWLQPHTWGAGVDAFALLPHWLGALSIRALAPLGVEAAFAARVPFMLMLALTLAATRAAVYHLAREPGAQPVEFAFGGEAQPLAYARALADGGLLALIATLGLAQGAHEAAPALAQLCCIALVFHALALQPERAARALALLALALPALMLSGAPWLALIYAALALIGVPGRWSRRRRRRSQAALLALLAVLAVMMWRLEALTQWRPPAWRAGAAEWRSLLRMVLWFTWPAWPLALWTLWRWRRQLLAVRGQRYLALPLALAAPALLGAVCTTPGVRFLLLTLPMLAALAALALPTFSRAASALIDWFTVLFFTSWAIVIWVVWVAMMTGVPAKPAANVARLAPEFVPVFQWPAFVAALIGTLTWLALARWRTGRHRSALWKSLALPAGGTALCWLLLMTLWLPALDYGRGYAAQMQLLVRAVGQAECVQVHALSAAQRAALRVYGGWPQRRASNTSAACPWMVTDARLQRLLPYVLNMRAWQPVQIVPRPADRDERLLLLRRVPPQMGMRGFALGDALPALPRFSGRNQGG